MFKNTKNIST